MYAWLHLTRLGGCNYKVRAVPYGKNSIHITDPQTRERHYRIKRDVFLRGERQFRDSWCIEQWSDKAERITESEKNWQT